MPDQVYVVSDLHLHDKLRTFMFCASKEAVFARLAAEVKRTDGLLVLNGDVFDLTGMTLPTRESLETFYRTAGATACHAHLERYVADRGTAPFNRALQERLESLAQEFPHLFKSLRELAADRRLRVLPGNHDWELLLPQNAAAFNRLLRVSDLPAEEQPATTGRFMNASVFQLVHGNDYDSDNTTDQPLSDAQPQAHTSGAIVTYAIYQALIPALVELAHGKFDPERILALDPRGNANLVDEISDLLEM